MATQMQFGGWYNNPAQGGRNMRYWGGNTWTAGEDPTGGRGVNWQQGAPATSAYTSGGGGLDTFTRGLMEQRAGLQSGLRGQEEDLFKQYETQRAGQETLPTAQARLETQYGVPGLKTQLGTMRGEVAGVKTQLDQLEGDITSRTSGSMVTEAQRRRMTEAEAAPLRDTLGRLASGQEVTAAQLSEANATVGQQLSLLAQQNNLDLQPILMRISAFSDRAAREMTGFDQNQQLQLNTYLDQLNRDRVLSDREWEQTSQLAIQERQYAHEMGKIQLQSQMDMAQSSDLAKKFAEITSPAPSAPAAPTNMFNRTLDDIFGTFSSAFNRGIVGLHGSNLF